MTRLISRLAVVAASISLLRSQCAAPIQQPQPPTADATTVDSRSNKNFSGA